jgi:antitoxin component of MazEF toxin-antitoxin module
MRFFKHGDSLAIVLPDSVRKRANLKEDEEYEFLLLEPGVFALVSRSALESKVRSSLVAELGARLTATVGGSAVGKSYSAPARPVPVGPVTPENARAMLEARGHLVLDNENLMKLISRSLERDVKEGRVVGVRGFDKKFYIVTSEFYSRQSQAIAKALAGGDRSSAEVARAAGCEEGAAVAVLQVMKDLGEAIEKKRGLYALVG